MKEKTSAPQEAEKKEKPAAAKGKPKFNLAESFKTQALIGDIDLSGRGKCFILFCDLFAVTF